MGIFILSNNSLIGDHTDYANDILQLFVTHFWQLYGSKFLSYSIHSLLHLAEDAKHHRILNNFSAFKYEDYLKKLKRLLWKPTCPPSQIVRRFSKMQSCSREKEPIIAQKTTYSWPSIWIFSWTFTVKEIKTCSYTLKPDQANSFVYIGVKVAKLQNIFSMKDEIYVAYSTINKNFFLTIPFCPQHLVFI